MNGEVRDVREQEGTEAMPVVEGYGLQPLLRAEASAGNMPGLRLLQRRKDAKPARRDYSVVPRFTPAMMQEDFDLQDVSNTIESALALWDQSFGHALNDNAALRVLEKLLDHLYFKEAVEASDEPIGVGYKMALSAIEEDLSEVPEETLIKILSAIYFVAKRRARGGRDYLDVIHKYVGTRAGKGIRILEME